MELENFMLVILIAINFTFSETAIFYSPILILEHFHLSLVHAKLFFVNSTVFTLLLFIVLNQASQYIEDRKLLVGVKVMEICAILLLMSLAISLDHVTSAQFYVMLVYICLASPFFAYALAISILSKITDPRNATLIQAVSYGMQHVGYLTGRIAIGFVFTKLSLVIYCFVLIILWLFSAIWYARWYKKMIAND